MLIQSNLVKALKTVKDTAGFPRVHSTDTDIEDFARLLISHYFDITRNDPGAKEELTCLNVLLSLLHEENCCVLSVPAPNMLRVQLLGKEGDPKRGEAIAPSFVNAMSRLVDTLGVYEWPIKSR